MFFLPAGGGDIATNFTPRNFDTTLTLTARAEGLAPASASVFIVAVEAPSQQYAVTISEITDLIAGRQPGDPTGLTAEDEARLIASLRFFGDTLNFEEGERRTYVMASVRNLSPLTLNTVTVVRFLLEGAGAANYRVSASDSRGYIPLRPSGTSALGTFAHDVSGSGIFFSVEAIPDADEEDPPPATLRFELVSGAFFPFHISTFNYPLRTRDAPRQLVSLRLQGADVLTQAAPRQPVAAVYQLVGLDQFGEAFDLGAAGFTVTATADAGARADLSVATSVDGLATTLTLTIAPDEDADAVVRIVRRGRRGHGREDDRGGRARSGAGESDA